MIERLRDELLRAQQESHEHRSNYLTLHHQLTDNKSEASHREALVNHLKTELVR